MFIDLQQAFYTVIRQAVVDLDTSVEAIATLVSRLKLPDNTLVRLRQRLDQPTTLEAAGVPAHLRAQVAESLQGTWFSVRGMQNLTQTTIGTRPGESLADLLFNFAFNEVLTEIYGKLKALGLTTQLPYSTSHTLHSDTYDDILDVIDASFMDDDAFVAMDASPELLLQRVIDTLKVIHETFAQRGFVLNYKRGKTEVLFALRGPKSRQWRVKVMIDMGGKISFTTNGQSIEVQVVQVYKHIGGMVTASGSMTPEAAYRRNTMVKEHRTLRKKVFSNPLLTTKHKAMLAQTYLYTRLFHNAQTWTPLNSTAHHILDTTIHKIAKSINKYDFYEQLDHQHSAQQLHTARLHSTTTHIHITTLRQLSRLNHNAPKLLLALYQHTATNPNGPTQQTLTSLRWMARYLPDKMTGTVELGDIDHWQQFACESKQRWAAWLRKVQDRATREELTQAKQRQWEESINKVLLQKNLPRADGTQLASSEKPAITCPQCTETFRSH